MNRIVFSQQNANATRNLYATDGTAAGTTDLDMPRFDFSGGSDFIEFDGRTMFLGSGGFGAPYTYVYTTDGTAAGTTGTSPGLFASSDGVSFTEIETGVGTDNLRVSHGIGYFAGDITNNSSNGLWRTDGTAAGTYDITPPGMTLNPADITSVINYRTILVNHVADGKGALWVPNGTAAGTYQIRIAALGTSIDVPQNGVTTNGKAIFSATDGAGDVGVWATNGLAAGTTELLVNGPASAPAGRFGEFTQWGGKVLFSTGDDVAVTDGTRAGTVRFSTGTPDFFVGVGNRVFIAAGTPSGAPVL